MPKELSPTSSKELQAKRWLALLVQVIKRNLNNQSLPLSQLALKMNMSERCLHYKVKKLTGTTPAKFINEFRLQKAKELLITRTYLTVKEVSFAVGFQKTSYFSQLYQKKFGCRPSKHLQF